MHTHILLDIRDKISSGEWAPGHKIPFETELARHFGVSRMTVNKVLSQLTQAGLLERRRKLGTVVRMPNVQLAVLEIADIEKEAKSIGSNYRHLLLARHIRKAIPADRNVLGLSSHEQILALTCLHLADDVPFCCEERLINLNAAPEAREADFSEIPPSKWLLSHVPWSSARHTISAQAATGGLAKNLAVKSGTPCLVVERITEHAGKVITHTKLTYPGDKHQMVAEFRPPSA